LIDIIAIALCGVIANCDGWTDIIDFANSHRAWFKRFLKLPNGIPSHDTFERVFAKIDPAVFNRCCLAWLRAVSDVLGLGHIAIDGKTLCGSASAELGPLHLVSAWATTAHLTLGEIAVAGKSNEITAIPELLKLLDLQGALVTIDAIGCQKAIAQQIVAKGGDYLLAVKANQAHLLEDIQLKKLLFAYYSQTQNIKENQDAEQQATITIAGSYFLKQFPFGDFESQQAGIGPNVFKDLPKNIEFGNNVLLRVANREELLYLYQKADSLATQLDHALLAKTGAGE